MTEKSDNRLLIEYYSVNWKELKKRSEVEISEQLLSYFYQNDIAQFRKFLPQGITKLRDVYRLLPMKKIHSEIQVRKNERITFIFEEMLRQEGSRQFLEAFLKLLPIVNNSLNPQNFKGDGLKIPKDQRPNKALHIAIRARVFDNVKFLLSLNDIDVNGLWRLQTPLMALFEIVDSTNFSQVLALVEILAVKQADINIGDRHRHPLTALSQNGNISKEQKVRLLTICSAKFDCDVDDLYEGRTRRDIEGLGLGGPTFGKSANRVTLRLLETLIATKKDEMFAIKFEHFKSSDLATFYNLLKLASERGRYVCVEKIFDALKKNEKFVQATANQFTLSKELKVACRNGFPRVQRCLQNNIKTRLDNDFPLLLTSVKELHRNRTPARQECFKLFVEDRRILVDKGDEEGQTALHFAAQHGMDQEALDIMIKRTPYLGQINENNETMLHLMKPHVLSTFLDSRLTIPSSSPDDDLRLSLYGLLPVQRRFNSVVSELDLLYYMSETEDFKLLLRHPVIGTFIQVKYLFMRWIFYTMIAISILFAISFNVYFIWNVMAAKVFCCLFLVYYLLDCIATLTADINRYLNQRREQLNEDQPKQRQKEFIFMNDFDLLHFLNKFRGLALVMLTIWSFAKYNLVTTLLVFLLSAFDVLLHLLLIPSISLSMSLIRTKNACKTFIKLVLVTAFSLMLGIYIVYTITHSNDNSPEIAQNPQEKSGLWMFVSNLGDLRAESNLHRCVCKLPHDVTTSESIILLWSKYMNLDGYDQETTPTEDDQEQPAQTSRSTQLVGYITVILTIVITSIINGPSDSDDPDKVQARESAAYAKWLENLRRIERILSFRIFEKFRHRTIFVRNYKPTIVIKAKDDRKITLTRSIKASQETFNIFPRWKRHGHGMDSNALVRAMDIVLKRNTSSFAVDEATKGRGIQPEAEEESFLQSISTYYSGVKEMLQYN